MTTLDDTMPLIRSLAVPFFDEGEDRVYAALCCDRVLVSVTPPTRCRTCSNTIEPIELTPNDSP